MRKFIYVALVALLAFVVIQSCSKSGSDSGGGTTKTDDNFDRKGLLTNISTNIIIPAYTAYQSSTVSLDAAVTAFNASPTATTLATLQAAFVVTYKQWQATSVFEFGPAAAIQLRDNTNTFPTDVTQITGNINSGTYIPGALANLSAKGLPALDYLLYSPDNATVLTLFTTDSKAANRKTYLATLSAELKANATTVLSGWSTYKATFIAADGTDASSSTALFMNQFVFDYETLKNREIGIPAGVQSAGTTYPAKIQAYYSKISVQLATLHTTALQNIYAGKTATNDGLGFDDYLVFLNAKYTDGTALNDVIKNQFVTALAKLQTLSDPLSTNITTNNAQVTATYAELQKLTVYLKTNMPAALKIAINYGDNDGD